MVKNIDEKENSFQDELQEDILNNNNNPSGIYLLWHNLIWERNCYLKYEKLGIPLRGLLSARLVAMYIAVAIRPRVLLIQ